RELRADPQAPAKPGPDPADTGLLLLGLPDRRRGRSPHGLRAAGAGGEGPGAPPVDEQRHGRRRPADLHAEVLRGTAPADEYLPLLGKGRLARRRMAKSGV